MVALCRLLWCPTGYGELAGKPILSQAALRQLHHPKDTVRSLLRRTDPELRPKPKGRLQWLRRLLGRLVRVLGLVWGWVSWALMGARRPR